MPRGQHHGHRAPDSGERQREAESQRVRERESERERVSREERFGRRNTDEWLKPAMRGPGYDASLLGCLRTLLKPALTLSKS